MSRERIHRVESQTVVAMAQERRLRQSLALVALAASVSVAYYLACEVGLRLRLPTATPSILWPPNAILTSALLLTRPRLWPLVLLSALPAHLIVEMPTGWPTPFILTLFVTNCLEALIAAGGMWWLSDSPARFDTFPRLVAFLVSAVIAAPILSSFADAAAVHGFLGEEYWLVWRTRVPGNMLSELAVVPAVVGTVSSVPRWIRRGWSRRTTEAALLGLGLIVSGSTSLAGSLAQVPALNAVSHLTPLTVQLPFLLWAAMRFGPVGAGVGLLAFSLIDAWALVNGQGPFASGIPATTVPAVTLSLIVQAVTLIGLATLVEERTQTAIALRTSELMKSTILQSLTTGIAVVDRRGVILALNDSWTRLTGNGHDVARTIGDNLLESCRAAARQGDTLADTFERGILAVLDQHQPRFASDRRVDAGATPRWWSVLVVPLGADREGAVVAITDVTDVRRAELEAQRTRHELAHLARVSTVGELTASLAHQLNQPLSAIMTNAQAARRMLGNSTPNVATLHDILGDIVRDDGRASQIIERLRKLIRRDEPAMSDVDLKALIRDVVDLVFGDAVIRGVTIVLDLDHRPLVVRGDSVQLQQVILNLLQNAMDAMSDKRDGARVVTIRCHAVDEAHVLLRVSDTGPGLPSESEDLFEPMYTTKPGGMGMGLSIARSIVDAHGGSIRGEREDHGGAAFAVTLRTDAGQDS
jgi:signal transduction histidine kinase